MEFGYAIATSDTNEPDTQTYTDPEIRLYVAPDGGIQLNDIPTSDPGVAGYLWRSGTDLKISTG